MNPKLVLLPGLDGTGRLFAPLLEVLADRWPPRVIEFSSDGPQDYEAIDREVRARLEKSAPYVLLGESFSGPIVARIAASPPPDLRAAIFVATFATPPRSLALKLAAYLPLTRLLALPPPDWILRRLCLGDDAPESLLALMRAAVGESTPQAMAARLRAIADVDVRSALPRIAIPCLYLQATEDAIVPASAAEPFMKLVQNIKPARVSAPHLALQAQPMECAAAIDGFLANMLRAE